MARLVGGSDAFFVQSSKYAQGLELSARNRYKENLSYEKSIKLIPYTYALADWVDEFFSWPNLSFGYIYFYLIETPSWYDNKSSEAVFHWQPLITLLVGT